jgi:hypothetical protein
MHQLHPLIFWTSPFNSYFFFNLFPQGCLFRFHIFLILININILKWCCLIAFNSFVGDSLAILRAELKSQSKHVKSLKKKSLWSKILEEVWSSNALRWLVAPVLEAYWRQIWPYFSVSYIDDSPLLIIVFMILPQGCSSALLMLDGPCIFCICQVIATQ